MRLLKIISDQDPGPEQNFKQRLAVRAIVFDDHNLIPFLFVSKYNYHKLPGGGLEQNEESMQALERELLEETGCQAKIIQEVGQIKELRTQWDLEQISDCYIGKILSKNTPQYTTKELAEGFILKWHKLDDVIKILESDKPENYEGLFIQQRDLIFLKQAKRILQNKATPAISKKGTNRSDIKPGIKVAIVLKKDQPTGKLTEGIVKDILTSSQEHHRGIKVRLQDGQVGRVQKIL